MRMSSDDQRTSIRQQEAEVRALAERDGYAISRWYREEGKSGSKDQAERIEFQQMLLDAAGDDFKAVLCYDSSRFARLDSIDGSFAKQVLRSKGIYLVTVKEGRIDWTTFEGRVMDMLVSEANHKYSRDLSLVSLRGRMDRLRQGLWPTGSVPYGYDRLYTFSNQTHKVARRTPFRKPRNWVLTLVPNEAEAAIVKELFEKYRKEDTSQRQLALELTRRGIPGPQGKKCGWGKEAVRQILGNHAYVGVGRMGMGRLRTKEVFNRAQPLEVAGVCPALVERDVFDVVQAKLASIKETGRRPQKYRSSLLSGVLVCGHCGYRMEKKSRKDYIYFVCSSATKRPHLGCHQWMVREAELLPFVFRLLNDEFERNVLAKLSSVPKSEPDQSMEALEKARDDLKAKIAKGNERYLTVPDDLAADLLPLLKGWRKELEGLEDRIRALQVAKSETRAAFEEWIAKLGKGIKVLADVSAPSTITTRPVKLPPFVLAAVRRRFGKRFIRCRLSWEAGKVSFDTGLPHEIDAHGDAWVFEQSGTFQMPIVAEDAVLRQFLHETGAKVTLFWKRVGTRNFQLDRGRLEAEFGKHSLGGSTAVTRRRKSPSLGLGTHRLRYPLCH